MKRKLKYLTVVLILLFVAYNSIYFRKLDEHRAAAAKDFDAGSYARTFYKRKLLPALGNAIELPQLMVMLHSDKEKTFDQYSHALGIGNIRFFLVKGEGQVTAVNENEVLISIVTDSSKQEAQIATEFVFGNAIRDASGFIDINEFKNSMDFNNVSAELNKIVRTEVLPAFKSKVKKGDRVQFSGALELNRVHLNLQQVEIVPVALNIKPS